MTVIVTFDRAAGELYLGSDEELMRAALAEARKAMAADEVPIGAVVAIGGDDRGGIVQSADFDRRSYRARRDSERFEWPHEQSGTTGLRVRPCA